MNDKSSSIMLSRESLPDDDEEEDEGNWESSKLGKQRRRNIGGHSCIDFCLKILDVDMVPYVVVVSMDVS